MRDDNEDEEDEVYILIEEKLSYNERITNAHNFHLFVVFRIKRNTASILHIIPRVIKIPIERP